MNLLNFIMMSVGCVIQSVREKQGIYQEFQDLWLEGGFSLTSSNMETVLQIRGCWLVKRWDEGFIMEAFIYAILDGEICIILLAELSWNFMWELGINMDENWQLIILSN